MRSSAFTIIELLVAISVIGLLLVILLPALVTGQESARRAQCASNTVAVAQTTIALGVENDNRYRLPHRQAKQRATYYGGYEQLKDGLQQNDHITWLNRYLFIDFIESGNDLLTFACPNRGVEFIKGEGGGGDQHDPRESTHPRWRTGFYYMAGRDQNRIVRANHGGSRKWRSPMSPEDPGDLPMMACILEQGTIDVDPGPARVKGSTYPHGTDGYIEVRNPWNTPPTKTESEGGNVSLNDGSTHWIPTGESKPFAVHLNAGNIIGWWNDTASYDAVNNR